MKFRMNWYIKRTARLDFLVSDSRPSRIVRRITIHWGSFIRLFHTALRFTRGHILMYIHTTIFLLFPSFLPSFLYSCHITLICIHMPISNMRKYTHTHKLVQLCVCMQSVRLPATRKTRERKIYDEKYSNTNLPHCVVQMCEYENSDFTVYIYNDGKVLQSDRQNINTSRKPLH